MEPLCSGAIQREEDWTGALAGWGPRHHGEPAVARNGRGEAQGTSGRALP